MLHTESNPGREWTVPETEDNLKTIFEKNSGVNLIYKHSYACGTCIFTKKQVEKVMEESSAITGWHFIDVRKNRPISNFVAEKTGIRHESPQAVLFHNGEVVWHGSHGAVSAEKILEAVGAIKKAF